MAHWQQHKAVWFPGRMKICGRRLRPFTLGHLRLLEIIESPFRLSGALDVRDADVGQAVAILAAPLWLSRWLVAHPGARRWAASWWLWRHNAEQEAAALVVFVNDCLWSPDAYKDQNEPSEGSVFGYASSFSMRVAWKLAGGAVPVKSHPVWRLSIIEALAWAVTAAELSGRGFVTRDEMEHVERMAAATAKAEAEKAQAEAVTAEGGQDGRQS